MITDINQLDFSKKYTYADYLTWQFKERVELIRGRLFKMSPAPNLKHQRIVMNVSVEISVFLKQKDTCQVFAAPFDVRFPIAKNEKPENAFTVLQPDIVVVCDESKLDKQGCNGAPDLIVEVLFPGNSKREMREKFEVYQQAGVWEYWIINPLDEYLLIYTLNEEGIYVGSRPYTKGMKVGSEVLKGFELSMDDVF